MARDPLIFLCHFVKGSKGPNVDIFIKKFRANFLKIHNLEIPIRPHVKFQKSNFWNNPHDPQIFFMI
jgi:hypothetical protein